jgi:16S rRNA (adenine1518-N6/adenine1519-N6)-dimethyltransferase
MKARAGVGRRRPPLGQHFLEESWRRRILEQLSPKPTDCWLEIGGGHGELTVPLAEASRAVVAVERDPRLATALRERLRSFPGAQVLEADILTVELELVARELMSDKLRVYGSLPYYITSPILRRLFDSLAIIGDIHVVVQREVAERLVAKPSTRDYGFLSVLTQFYTEPELLLAVPRGAFRPTPKVDSVLVRLGPPGAQGRLRIADSRKFVAFLGACFRQKRKTLANSLRGAYARTQTARALAAAGLDPRVRAEELSIEVLAGLYVKLAAPERD